MQIKGQSLSGSEKKDGKKWAKAVSIRKKDGNKGTKSVWI